ncbi:MULTISPECIES: class I SAM-dependent methyltransferase [Streptomyces]|uniref:Class I SAM-dependent methyltransferase n=1 Tax=Streptomyces luteosporeus TaxID=173856 RepID=A0ABN3TL16_9ACTN
MRREKVALHGAPETMLATLYGRALDSRAAHPVLGDAEAARTVRLIDYDFRRTGVTRTGAAVIALRARVLDEWTIAFLSRHPAATVLHLACGLDGRVRRVAPGPAVCWVDVDYPEVTAVRERLLRPPAGGDYRLIGSSVTDGDWLRQVPADRPTAVVFEGLSMYLHKADGERLIRNLTARFPRGELFFDAFTTFGIRLEGLIPPVRRAGATLHWAVDDPREPQAWHEGLRCLDVVRLCEAPGAERLPPAGRLGLWVTARTPGLRDAWRLLRYAF